MVKSDTARRVWKSIRSLGNIRSLSEIPRVRTQTDSPLSNRRLGLLISPLSRPSFAELAVRFQEAASTLGYETIICPVPDDADRMGLCLRRLSELSIQGIAVTSHLDENINAELKSLKMPVIYIDPILRVEDGGILSVNYRSGIREGVQHLAVRGHRKIAYIGGDEHSWIAQLKRDAFIESAREIGCMPKKEWLIDTEASILAGLSAMETLIASTERPTAVICSCEALALGALSAMRRSGCLMPDHMSLISFDNGQLPDPAFSTVTAVRVSSSALANAAASVLDYLTKKPARQIPRDLLKVPTSMILSSSTGYPTGQTLPLPSKSETGRATDIYR